VRRTLGVAREALLFFWVITRFPSLFERVRGLIEREFGALHPQGTSPEYPFPETKAYARTMGSNLSRKFFVLAKPWPQDGLAEAKLRAIEMEESIEGESSWEVARPVNIDPGLLAESRIVLATTKERPHRLYRTRGVWEEVTLLRRQGTFEVLPWTYPDFRSSAYHEFFAGLEAGPRGEDSPEA